MEGQQELQQQLVQLISIVENMQERIATLERANQVLITANRKLMEWQEDIVEELVDYKDNVYFEIIDEAEHEKEFWYPKIEAGEQAVDKIVNEGYSISRFGDGEFSVIEGRVRHKFQTKADPALRQRLLEVLHSQEKMLLIGIADNYGSLEKYNEQAKREIRRYLKRSVRQEHLRLLDKDRLYYDAYMTRPYVMYRDNDTGAPRVRFDNLKRIWDRRDCVFVEGSQTGLGVGNDLFQNAKSIRRIVAPAVDAFDAYEKIYDACSRQNKDTLFLLALGPAATVLAYDLCKAGYQAVDVGHVDLEYEWFLKGEGHRTPIAEKYNNEISEGQNPLKIQSREYESQIIAKLF